MVDIFSAIGIWRLANRPTFRDSSTSKTKRKSKSRKSRPKPQEVRLSPKVPRIRRLSEVSDIEDDDPTTPVCESHETLKEWHDDGDGCCQTPEPVGPGRKRVISFSDYVTVHRYL